MGLKLYQSFPETTFLKIVGDIGTVLNGKIDNAHLHSHVLNQLKFALGAATPSDCLSVGEGLILNQKGYTCYVDKNQELITKKSVSDFSSPFLMGVGLESKPSDLFQIDYPQGISLNELFKELYQYPVLAYLGALFFDHLSCSYLKIPPIYKENIVDNYDKYWAKPEDIQNCSAYVFGVIIQEEGQKNIPVEKLNHAFYINPGEKNKENFLSHSHAVLLKNSFEFSKLKNENFYQNIDTSSMFGVRHVFTQSIVNQGLMAVFNIKDIA